MKMVYINHMEGQIRVGKIKYEKGKKVYPYFKDFTPIIVMTASSKYGSLSPYQLKDRSGRIMENLWQFSKVYEKVPKSTQRYSRWDSTIIWKHPAEVHVDLPKGMENSLENIILYGQINEKYKEWRKKGFNCEYAVRYPIGRANRHKCLYALATTRKKSPKKLDYVTARKEIYLPLYDKLVKKKRQFKNLIKRHDAGENLLIVEVDGPHQESLEYYQKEYGVADDFIIDSTMLVNKKNLKIMLNDPKHPFGHGYCLAAALMGIDPFDLT